MWNRGSKIKTRKVPGRIVSPRKVVIVDSVDHNLKQGQRVLLCTESDHKIVSVNGEVLGNREQVLGLGEVVVDKSRLLVKTQQTMYEPKKLVLADKKAPYTIGARFTVKGNERHETLPLNMSMNQRNITQKKDVYIKIIDE